VPQQVQGVIARSKGVPVEVVEIVIPDPGPGRGCGGRRRMRGMPHRPDIWEGGINDEFPFLLGHEAAGTVERIGAGVDSVEPGDFVILNWRAVCGQCRACKRGRPQYCFSTFNASQRMTLLDGTELTPALGIGAFAEKTLVHAGQCASVDPAADPAVAGCWGAASWPGLARRSTPASHAGAARGVSNACARAAHVREVQRGRRPHHLLRAAHTLHRSA
jgi:S-(hydroxymethyl)mycothiol dehydrogenase